MLFSSTVFLFAFLPATLLIYYGLLRNYRRGQNVFLLLASLLFYAWGEPSFVAVMLLSIGGNYLLGLWAAARRGAGKATAPAVATAAAVDLGLLFVFKYLTFTVVSLRSLGLELPMVNIALPVGISFFTFQALSYVIDVARGDAEVQKNPLWVGLYIAFFPQLIAGPIVTYQTVAQQILHRKETWEDFSQGCYRFLIGLGKKVLLSNQLAVMADAAFDGGAGSVAMAWLGSVAYTLQIYLDFSGYSDMAIGLGKMFGFHFKENFRYPYLADSCRSFWQRWHISLTDWFRSYLYIPLGGNRMKSRWGVLRNTFLVWLFTGVWHGANWTFLCWGLAWFVLLTLERRYHPLEGKPLWLRRTVMFLIANFTWVLFRADSLGEAGQFLLTMFKGNTAELWSQQAGYYLSQNWLVLAASALCCFPSATWLRGRLCRLAEEKELTWLMPLWNAVSAAAVAALGVWSSAFLVKGTYNPFIYFNF